MLKRTISTIVGIAILLPILYFSDTFVFPVAVAFFIAVALFEIFGCVGQRKNILLTAPLYLFGIAAPFAVRYMTASSHYLIAGMLALNIILLYFFALIVFSKNKINLSAAASVFFPALYIIIAFCGIIYLRDLRIGNFYLLIFISAWVTDIFAYLTGMLFGKHKLIPELSPKKTIEGSIGGMVFSAAAFTVTALLLGIPPIGLPVIIVCGLLASFVAQVGDLSMSAVKRQYGVKDFGKLMPGHGGVLDRFDSILAVSLFMTVMFAIIELLGLG